MPGYAQLPGYNVNALMNFQPVNNALSEVTQQNNANRNAMFQQQASDRADQSLALQKQTAADEHKSAALNYERSLAQAYGGWAQNIASNPDPAARATMAKALFDSHPEFVNGLTKNGIDPNDVDTALKFVTSTAQGYQNPLDVRLKTAQIAGAESENAVRGKSWGVTGQNVYGQPVYGMVDLTKPNGGITPSAPANTAAAGSLPPGQGPTGADYLATLPKPMADQVKAISEGRIPIPGGFALKTPYWQQMMTHVSQYDPTFDAVNYNARAATRKDFTSGKSAQNITSFNTAIGHLDTLDKAIDGLNNGAYPSLNAIKNASVQAGNTDRGKALAHFDSAKDAVSKELVKAFRGTGGSLTEIQGMESLLDSTKSPQELHAVAKQYMELLHSRIEAVGDQYNKGMGLTSDPIRLLSPKAQEIWSRLSRESASEGEGVTKADAAPSGTPLAAPKSKAEYDALPSGTRYTDPNGTPRVKP